MGFPVSAFVANLCMEFFEELALRSAPAKLRRWKLGIECGLHLLYHEEGHNGRTPEAPQPRETIYQVYTSQVEKDGILPFLETLLQRRDDVSLDVTVYRKLTHTDRYLDFWSHHPSHVKRGLVRCLYDGARSITTRQDNLQKEECHLTKVLKQNGYFSAFIRSSSLPSGWDVETIEAPPLGEGHRPPLV